MTALLLAMALLTQQGGSSDAPPLGLNMGLLFYSAASADLNSGLKTLSSDTLVVFPRGSYQGDWVKLSATAALEYSTDSTFSGIDPVSAGAFFKWPGSPWLGSGVSMGLVDPFIAGFDVPVREWNSHDVMDSTVVTIEAGGLMGFQGFWNQLGDSLSWYGVRSPWLGFGTVGWDGISENSTRLQTYSGFLDLRRVQPWFLFVREDSQWTYLTELRGWHPVENRHFYVEVVPELYLEEGSNRFGLTGYLYGKGRAVSASLQAIMDIENEEDHSYSLGLDILSEAGIAWALDADLDNSNELHGELSGFYRRSPAGCGGAVEMFDDSLRATATALYSPVQGVAAELSVMSNLSTEEPKPGCLLTVFGAKDDFTGRISVQWREGSTTLGLEVSAWID